MAQEIKTINVWRKSFLLKCAKGVNCYLIKTDKGYLKRGFRGHSVMSFYSNTTLHWVCIGMLLLLSGCAVPRVLWLQKDLPPSETVGVADGPVVLVASRSSEFKKALVEKLTGAIVSEGLAEKTVGVGDLKGIVTAEYGAVVVISTCRAWGLERDVQTFLDRQKTHANIILVTTSGGGDWLPDKGGRDIDAISSASRLTSVEGIARDVLGKIKRRLGDF